MDDYDNPWKEILDSFFESFVEFFFPQAYNEIDWSRGFESLDTELRQIVREAEHRRRTVDKLVKVWLKSGQAEWVLVHIEVQTQEADDFEERMFVYNFRLYDIFGRAAVSLAVLGDDRPDWRPSRFRYERWGCSMDFQFPTVKLLDYAGDLKALGASENPFATVVLAHLKTRETRHDLTSRRAWKVELVKGLYERGYSQDDVRQLFRFIVWIMALPPELDKSFWKDLQIIEESKKMPYVTQLEEIWLAEGIEKGIEKEIEQGIEKGIEQGMETGRQLGLEHGLRDGLLAGLELVLELKFGAEGRALLSEIRLLPSSASLRAVYQAISNANTIDELRQAVFAARELQNGVH